MGAGVLISAVAYELVYEAVRIGKYSRFPALGLFAGALTFFFADWLIGRIGGNQRKDIDASHQSKLVVPLIHVQPILITSFVLYLRRIKRKYRFFVVGYWMKSKKIH